jgi:hypothetical protein
MPVEVRGLKETLRALKNFEPDVEKNLNKELRAFAAPVVKKSKGFIVAPSGLSNWSVAGSAKSFKQSNPEVRKGFPKFNVSTARAGIRFSTKPTKRNSQGFISLYRIVNSTAAGAIYETAGRKNPGGQPWNPSSSSKKYSHSKNPNAGRHFINSLGALEGRGMMKGRSIFKAWEQDQGKAYGGIIKAVDSTLRSYERTAKK